MADKVMVDRHPERDRPARAPDGPVPTGQPEPMTVPAGPPLPPSGGSLSTLGPAEILALQRTIGNRAVVDLLAATPSGSGASEAERPARRQTTSAMPGWGPLRREPAPGGPTPTPEGGQPPVGETPATGAPAWATEDLKRKLAAVVLAEAGPGQENEVRWIYLTLVTAAEGESGLKASSAYNGKGIEYRLYLYQLGDPTHGSDTLPATPPYRGYTTIADYCARNPFWKNNRVKRATDLKALVDAMLIAPQANPYPGWIGQGSLEDINEKNKPGEYWKQARAYYHLQEAGKVTERYVEKLEPTVPSLRKAKKGYTFLFHADAIKDYFAAHPEQLPEQVPPIVP